MPSMRSWVFIHDRRLQNFDGRESKIAADIHIDRNNLQLDGIAVSFRVIPARQRVKAVVDHHQRIAQVLLTLLATRQLAKLVVVRVFSDGL